MPIKIYLLPDYCVAARPRVLINWFANSAPRTHYALSSFKISNFSGHA